MIATPSRKTARRSPARRRVTPMVESFEPRLLMAAGVFLQGTAFIDANADGALGTNDPYLPGATIQLFRASDLNNPIAATTSNAKGQYRFDDANVSGGLAPGNYKLVETPPTGFVNSAAQVLSQLNPATVPAGSKNSILVTVADPSQDKVTFDSSAFFNLNHYDVLLASVAGLSPTVDTSTGQLPVVVGGALPTSQFLTYCVDLGHQLATGTNVFSVLPRPVDSLPGNGGAVAYLYNHYGTAPIASTTQAVGLQLAIWQLEYGNALTVAPDLTYTSAAELAAAQVFAASYVAEAAGKSETAVYLDANVAGVTPLQDGMQGVIATGSLNFGNVKAVIPQSLPVTISGNVYEDKDASGTLTAADSPIGNVVLTLNDANGNIVATTTTASNGTYSFTTTKGGQPIAPGTYKVVETQPAGYLQGSNTVGTVNNVVDGTLVPVDTIGSIVLASGQNSVGNNFGEVKPVSINGSVFAHLKTGCDHPGGSVDIGLPNVPMTLKTAAGVVVATTKTDANGQYSFTNLAPGNYTVTEEAIPAADGSFTHQGQTSTTSGALTTTPRVVSNIALTSGAASTDTFFEVLCDSGQSSKCDDKSKDKGQGQACDDKSKDKGQGQACDDKSKDKGQGQACDDKSKGKGQGQACDDKSKGKGQGQGQACDSSNKSRGGSDGGNGKSCK